MAYRLVETEPPFGLRRHPTPAPSDADLIEQLKTLLAREGRLTRRLIQADTTLYSPSVYQRRFDTLGEAYKRAGFDMAGSPVGQGRGAAKRLAANTQSQAVSAGAITGIDGDDIGQGQT